MGEWHSKQFNCREFVIVSVFRPSTIFLTLCKHLNTRRRSSSYVRGVLDYFGRVVVVVVVSVASLMVCCTSATPRLAGCLPACLPLLACINKQKLGTGGGGGRPEPDVRSSVGKAMRRRAQQCKERRMSRVVINSLNLLAPSSLTIPTRTVIIIRFD